MHRLPTIIAGPCAAESFELMTDIALEMKSITSSLGFPYVFKSSFEKANRSSFSSYVGPGIDEGLTFLARVAQAVGVRTTTDIHEPWQAEPASKVVDILQIPALLSRQTPLILAAAKTQLPVNVKRGQFMAPWKVHLIKEKVRSVSDAEVIITERGTMNGYSDLVVDFRTLVEAREAGCSAGFDATHSVQLPSVGDIESGGNPKYISSFALAAAAIGVDFLFFETHPDPAAAKSDGACMIPLGNMGAVLAAVKATVLAKFPEHS